ncbi:MAG: NADH-quinone oxidoreductase subunit C [Alphaproteobacteria bacterium]|nr:NADH-quinone oxidoreductase subunit C [Alphaproteobacteria bacterium]
MSFKSELDMLQYICLNFSKQDILKYAVEYKQPFLYVVRSVLPKVISFIKEDSELQFNMLLDMTAIHYPDRSEPFQIRYLFYSSKLKKRLTIYIFSTEDVPIQTISNVYLNADWYERELHEMFGILFDYHSDFRALFLSDCETYPLRKDKL